VVRPLFYTYLRALKLSPPLQPKFPYKNEQSTNYYSDNAGSGFFLTIF
jgi:hypothetical protein